MSQIDITIATQEIQIAKISMSVIQGLQCAADGFDFFERKADV